MIDDNFIFNSEIRKYLLITEKNLKLFFLEISHLDLKVVEENRLKQI